MTRGPKRRRRVIRGPIACLVGVFVLVVSFYAAEEIVDRRSRQVVSRGGLPRDFPLIVFAPPSPGVERVAHLVSAEHLDGFLSAHPGHSFLIPEGREWDVVSQLKSPDERFTGGLFFDSFNVERLPSGRQLISVNAPVNTDRFNVARYEATDIDITPHDVRRGNYRFRGPAVLLLTLSFTFVALLLMVLAEWAWLRKQREPTGVQNDVHG